MTTIIFTLHVLAVLNVEIPLGMVRRCICKVSYTETSSHSVFKLLYVCHLRSNSFSFLGGAIWHPRCGPGPTENGAIINGVENGHCTDTETEAESGRDTAFDRMSSSAVSDMQVLLNTRLTN